MTTAAVAAVAAGIAAAATTMEAAAAEGMAATTEADVAMTMVGATTAAVAVAGIMPSAVMITDATGRTIMDAGVAEVPTTGWLALMTTGVVAERTMS